MNRLSTLAVLISFSIASPVYAQSYPSKAASNPLAPTRLAVCPWLTEGSAAAALGGSVRVVLNIASDTQGICTFTKKDAPESQIKIVVGAPDVPACPIGSASILGIGTQANRCRLMPSHDLQTEMISGKVRAVRMAVTLSGVGNASSTASDYRPKIGINQIAEQVAGNLF